MQLTLTETKQSLGNWCDCNIMDLSKNFFGVPDLPGSNSGFEEPYTGDLFKVKSLYLSGEEIISAIKKEGQGVSHETEFKISFGLRELGDYKLRVMPILRVINAEKVSACNFGFVNPISGYENSKIAYGRGDNASAIGGFQVPETYLDLVTRTWSDSRISKIEDVFTSKVVSGLEPTAKLSKLLGYNISPATNPNVHDMMVQYLANISPKFELAFIGFHFGIDLNKVDIVNTFSYVTVLEFRLKHREGGKTGTLEFFSEHHNDILFDSSTAVNVLRAEDDEETVQVLYQYMQPCPPFGNCEN
ncbi:hypothetical protein [Roseivirga pacifica]|uniref:hypothetical protein n=1 Tax=Roseivirga pacifica TaxID=1267423 RepID=UPI00227A6D2D|nr:hypothetical protein [Roseivirga pacifica]